MERIARAPTRAAEFKLFGARAANVEYTAGDITQRPSLNRYGDVVAVDKADIIETAAINEVELDQRGRIQAPSRNAGAVYKPWAAVAGLAGEFPGRVVASGSAPHPQPAVLAGWQIHDQSLLVFEGWVW